MTTASTRTIDHWAETARAAIDRLSGCDDRQAFDALLALSAHLGVALGQSARLLAERGSWSKVADAAGMSRQAAWARWHE